MSTVSVVIPTYNHCEFVISAIESVMAQTHPDREIIVVNDGSSDGTAELLKPLAQASQIRYYEQANSGQASARNRGLSEARGALVAFLDDDDVWPVDKLAWQVEALRAEPQAALAYGSYRTLMPDGNLIHIEPPQDHQRPSGDVLEPFRRQCWMISPGQALIRTEAVRAIGGFDENIWGADDWDLYIRLAKLGPFIYQDRVALHYRRHSANASSSSVLRHARGHLEVVRRHTSWWERPLRREQRRAGARYFLENLLRHARDSRNDRRYVQSLQAQLYALRFSPSLLFQRRLLAPLVANLFRIPPRNRRRNQ